MFAVGTHSEIFLSNIGSRRTLGAAARESEDFDILFAGAVVISYHSCILLITNGACIADTRGEAAHVVSG